MVKIIQTYFINLEKRKDKRERTESELRKSRNPKIKRFNAVNGPDEFKSMIELVKRYQKVEFHPFIFRQDKVRNTQRYRAKISCWLSHFTILKQYFKTTKTNQDWICITEDDIKTMYSWNELQHWVDKTLARIHDADIIILSDRIGVCGKNNKVHQFERYKKNKNFGLECYLVRCTSIDKFFPELYLNKIQNFCSLDNKIYELNQLNHIKVIPLEGPPFTLCVDLPQKDSDIEIENTIEGFSYSIEENATWIIK